MRLSFRVSSRSTKKIRPRVSQKSAAFFLPSRLTVEISKTIRFFQEMFAVSQHNGSEYRYMGRRGTSNTKTGGENSIPRSLGVTLRAIRKQLGLSSSKMYERLKATESPYEFPISKSKVGTKNGQVGGATISTWETAQSNIPFSVQHRYGILSNSYSGIIHLVSLAYANIRDAQSAVLDETERHARIAENERIVRGLRGFANAIEQLSKAPNSYGVLSQDSAVASKDDIACIKTLLASFTDADDYRTTIEPPNQKFVGRRH
jgi:hypothetical protein